MDPDDRLLTVREVADTIRVSNMTVYRLIRGGELKAIRVGRSFRIRESDVDRFLDDRAVPDPVAPLAGPMAGPVEGMTGV